MKRRDFFAVAGVGAGTVVLGVAGATMAADEPKPARSQIWQCSKCGAIIEVLVPGKSLPMHCDQPMELLEAQTEGPLANSHVPVITKVDGGFKVAVGAKPHPMLKSHWIQWIELMADDKVYRQFLNPGDKPEALFRLEAQDVSARAHCNLHGLWKSK